jgi:glutamyl-tRNA reductase
LKEFRVIAFTHRNTPLDQVGKYHIDDDVKISRLSHLKQELALKELVYLSTCNRVEFVFLSESVLNNEFQTKFFKAFNPEWAELEIEKAIQQAQTFSGNEAVSHVFHVAASLDSLVVGEREILTQVRTSFELCIREKLAGDTMRVLLRKVVESSKDVYTKTDISKNPVSVVSLAYRQLRDLNINKDARILIIGAGQTNTNLSKYLQKHGFKNFTVFNRSLERAQELAGMLKGNAFALSELSSYSKGFDVLVTCTAASEYLINPDLYTQLLQGDTDKKVIIDLAIPYDVHPEVYHLFNIFPILVESLKQAAEDNLALRQDALVDCKSLILEHLYQFEELFRGRKIERAMQDVPKKIREIHENAVNKVFAREMEALDATSRETVEKMLSYLEKKYISVPMKLAKEILLEQN